MHAGPAACRYTVAFKPVRSMRLASPLTRRSAVTPPKSSGVESLGALHQPHLRGGELARGRASGERVLNNHRQHECSCPSKPSRALRKPQLALARRNGFELLSELDHLLPCPFAHYAVGRCLLVLQPHAGAACHPWPDGSRREASTAVGTYVLEHLGNAGGTEGALVAADPRELRVRCKIAVAAFTVRSQL